MSLFTPAAPAVATITATIAVVAAVVVELSASSTEPQHRAIGANSTFVRLGAAFFADHKGLAGFIVG